MRAETREKGRGEKTKPKSPRVEHQQIMPKTENSEITSTRVYLISVVENTKRNS